MSTSHRWESVGDIAPGKADAGGFNFEIIVLALAVTGFSFVIAWLSLAVLGPGQIAPIWPVNGLILAALLRNRRRDWPLLLAAGVAGITLEGVATHGVVWKTLGLASCNAPEIGLSALAITTLIPGQVDLSRLRDVVVCGAAAILSAAVGAGCAGAWLGWLGQANVVHSATVWTLGDGLGQMIGAPIMLAVTPFLRRRSVAPGRAALAALSLAALAAAVAAVFLTQSAGLEFLIFAPLLLVVFQLEVLGAALGVLLTAVIAVALTVSGHGPLALDGDRSSDKVVLLQIFLLATAVVNFPIAATLADRRRAQAVLSLSEARLRFMGAHSRDVVVRVGLDRRIVDISSSCRRYGYAPEDLIGRLGAELNHPDDRATVTAMIDELIADPRRDVSAMREWRTRVKSGDWLWMRGNVTVIRSADGDAVECALVMRDITQERAAAAALLESEAKYRLLVENATCVIVRCNVDGVITYASPSAEKVSGYAVEDLVGARVRDLIHPDDLEATSRRFREFLATAQPGEQTRYEYRMIRKDGAVIWLEANPTLYFDPQSGALLGVLDFVRDITVRKAMEADLQHKRAEAEAAEIARRAAEIAARDSLSELARVSRLLSVGEFATSVAHELNQPIAAIVTNSDTSLRWLAKQPPNLDEARAAIGRTIRDANRAAAVIARTRAMLAKTPPTFSALDLNECAEQVLLFLETELRQNAVIVHRRFGQALPLVRGDRIQLEQVMLNLIRNAVEAMADTKDRPRILTLTTHAAEDDKIVAAFEDTGPGVRPEVADRLFDGVFTTKIGGIGLGLAISRSIIEAHGGRLWVSPGTQQGALFQFTVTTARGAAP